MMQTIVFRLTVLCVGVAPRLLPPFDACSSLPFEQQVLAQQQAAAQQLQAQAQQQLLAQAQLVAAQQPSVQATLAQPSASPQQLVPLIGALPGSGALAQQGDVDMANAEAAVAPIVIHNPKEPVGGGFWNSMEH